MTREQMIDEAVRNNSTPEDWYALSAHALYHGSECLEHEEKEWVATIRAEFARIRSRSIEVFRA